MTQLSPLLRDDLPADFDTSSVDEVFELYGAVGSRSGNTVLLRNRGTWQVFTRTSMFGPLKQVPLTTGVAIELRQEGWKKELVITAADAKTHVFDVPMFDQERAQKCFAQPQSKPAVQLLTSSPAPPAAPRLAVLDAPVFTANSRSAEPDDSALTAEVIKLLPVSKIQAIKLYRERTGVGLKEAKDAVEAIEALSESKAAAAPVLVKEAPSEDIASTGLEAEVLKLLPVSKIQAIKLYRERTGVGLKEAKDAVEAIEAKFPSPSVSVARRRAPSDGIQPAPSGSGTSSEVPFEGDLAMKKASNQAQKKGDKKHSNEQAKQVLNAAQENLERTAPQRGQAAPKASFSFMLVLIISAFMFGIVMATAKC